MTEVLKALGACFLSTFLFFCAVATIKARRKARRTSSK
jgi:organic hydroperoxide reductase OsmC/OhrA